MSRRSEIIRSKMMPSGNIRFYRDAPGLPGVSEMQITDPKNVSVAITTAHGGGYIIEYHDAY